MFTDEFIIKACEYSSKETSIRIARHDLRKLGINNKEVTQELNNIEAAAIAYNMLAVNYMYSFVPEELRQLLKVIKVTGAYATSYSSDNRFSLHASIRLHLESGVLDLFFDNTNKCLYTNSFFNERSDFYREISIHINPVPDKFNCWIVAISTNK